jgi:hypothetical protein
MGPRLEKLPPSVDRHARRAAGTARHPHRPARPVPARATPVRGQPSERSVPERRPPSAWDRGLTLLLVFTASALLIVALVALVAAVDRWWVVIPVMAADLAVTAAVLVCVARLLGDGESR